MARQRPFKCPKCEERFVSMSALNQHHSAKHAIKPPPDLTVLEGHRKPDTAVLPFRRAMMAVVLSMASATLYALLARGMSDVGWMPIWGIPIAANFGGLITGFGYLAVLHYYAGYHFKRKTVAQKTQKAA